MGGWGEEEDSDKALVAVSWNDGGINLNGVMVIRYRDGFGCYANLSDALMDRLETLDRRFVMDNAGRILREVYEVLPFCIFRPDRIVSPEFLLEGLQPAVAGTMRHLPKERIACEMMHVPHWRTAGYVVDVGEVDLSRALIDVRVQ